MVLTRFESLHQLLGIEVGSYGVLLEQRSLHELVGLVESVEGVNLRLDPVSI